MGYRVAVVGATGNVGREMMQVLAERGFPCDEVAAVASSRSQGTEVEFGDTGKMLKCKNIEHFDWAGWDIALFSAGSGPAKEYAPKAAAAGCVVIDNSSLYRMDPDVPLIVPEVNPEAVKDHQGIIANPNCTTILLVVVLEPLRRAAGLKRITVATYQAASGAGARAMEELETQARAILAGQEPVVEHFPQPIGFNLFPHIDRFLPEEDWATKEEMKVVWESRKILGLPDLAAVSTCVRVPVLRAHSEAVFLELERELSPEAAREALSGAPGVRVVDDPAQARYPTPRQADGIDDVLVGRIRRDPTCATGLCLFLAGDQLRKGAALNAVQIAELL
ncbi:MAG TPA: aspartate-semialdehyde dehydrogenase [Planctomycetes bacterium]|nr:aspartate-semialdehyde dehydrogenase [Planctomycetota bacterium]